MAGNLTDLGFGGTRKPMQRGVISITAGAGSATITAVNTSKARLINLGGFSGSTANGVPLLVLTNPTTISAAWNGVSGSVSWELEEDY